ncbi:hypothetical protein LJC29_07060, partial [Bacteroides sp. OttesenSCG-928-N06]|nr:hypothetical protein [Bacteroides sp. OttesenSCG-928-N06]
LPVLAIPLIKGVIGAVVDAGAQIAVSMANGNSFNTAFSNIDYTSVGSSFVTSAIGGPGMSTTAKVVTGTVIAADAMVDISISKGVEYIGENKPITNAAVDAFSSIVPGKVVDEVTSNFNKAIASDLAAGSATMSKGMKSSLSQAEAVVNSSNVQTGANAVMDFAGGIIGGQMNESIEANTTRSFLPPPNSSFTHPTDAIRSYIPILP